MKAWVDEHVLKKKVIEVEEDAVEENAGEEEVDEEKETALVKTLDGLVGLVLKRGVDERYAEEADILEAGLPDEGEETILEALSYLEELRETLEAYKVARAEAGAFEGGVEMDVEETVLWRVGSLAYMVASCLLSDEMGARSEGRLHEVRARLPEMVATGIDALSALVVLRIEYYGASQSDEGGEMEELDIAALSGGQDELHQLLGMGMYSTPHLLALVYSADLTLWASIHPVLEGTSAQALVLDRAAKAKVMAGVEDEEVGVRELSKAMYERFIYILESLIPGSGWDPQTARDQLAKLAAPQGPMHGPARPPELV